MYNGEDAQEDIFPTFNAPQEPGFQQGGCNWWVLCTNVLADWVGFIAQGVIYVVLLLIEIIRMLVVIVVLIVSNAFTGFDGAPAWFNGLILVGMGGAFAVSIYKAVRKGDTDSS
jgi:hypothetical protein